MYWSALPFCATLGPVAGGNSRKSGLGETIGQQDVRFGDALRHARANKGVTLTEAERAIRIPRKYLRALEDEDFLTLPEGVYSRGIVRNYAQYLNLDPDDAISYFEDLRGGVSNDKVVPAVKPLEMPSHWAPNSRRSPSWW